MKCLPPPCDYWAKIEFERTWLRDVFPREKFPLDSEYWRWPTDYVSLDGGRLLVRPDFLDALRQRGWNSVAEVMSDADVSVARTVESRDNCSLQLGGRLAFLKRHREPNAPCAAGLHEADAVEWCRLAGVPTMQVIAAGAERIGKDTRSFFLSESLPGQQADHWWRSETNADRKRLALLEMGRTASAFHSHRLYHRDFYWCHFFIVETIRGDIKAHLIDLQRVLHRPHWGWRWQIKDLAQFWKSMPEDISASDRQAWFSEYLGTKRTWGLPWMVRSRAAFYRLKDGRA